MARGTDTSYKWDFFISYTRADQAWAEWIAWVLEEDGHRVLIQAWDFVPGSNWIRGMQAGTRDAARTVAVLSDSYLSSVYGSTEWQAALARDADGADRRLLVVRVEACERPGLLAAVVSIDLFGLSETAARARLQTMVVAAETGRAKPTIPPRFPGEARAVPREPSFPGNDRDSPRPGAPPQDQVRDSAPTRGGNWYQWYQLQPAVVQATVIGGIFTILGAVVTGIFALISLSHAPTRPPGETGNLVTLVSQGARAIAYSFDGNYLAAGNANGVVRVWRTNTWQLASTMTDPHSKGVSSVAFNPASSLLAVGDANGHVYLWASGHAKVLTDPSDSAIRSVTFSQDNKYLAAGDANGMVTVWRTRNWHVAGSMRDPGSSGVSSVAFNPANSLLAAGDANGHVYLWASGHAKALTDPSGAAIRSVVFTADNVALVGGDSSGHVYVWHVASRKVAEHLSDPNTKGVESVAFDSSTKTIAAADGNGKVYLWLYKLTRVLQYPTSSAILSAAYNPHNTHLAVVSASGKVYVKLVNP